MPAYRTRDTHHSRSLEVTVDDTPTLSSSSHPHLTLLHPTPRAHTIPHAHQRTHTPSSSSQSNSPFEPEPSHSRRTTTLLTTSSPSPSSAAYLSRKKTVTPSTFFASPSQPHPSSTPSTPKPRSSTPTPASSSKSDKADKAEGEEKSASAPKYHRRRRSNTNDANERRPKKGDEDYVKRPENAFILFRRKCCEDRNSALAAAPPTTSSNSTSTSTTSTSTSTSMSTIDSDATSPASAQETVDDSFDPMDDGEEDEDMDEVVEDKGKKGKGGGGNGKKAPAPPTTKKQRQADLSKMISQQWKNLSAEERQYWEDLAKEKKKEHEALYPHYVYRPQRVKGKKNVMKAKGKAVALTATTTAPIPTSASDANDTANADGGEILSEGKAAEGEDEPSLSFTLPVSIPAHSPLSLTFPNTTAPATNAPSRTNNGRRASSVPTPPPPFYHQTIQIPTLMMPTSTPTSPSGVGLGGFPGSVSNGKRAWGQQEEYDSYTQGVQGSVGYEGQQQGYQGWQMNDPTAYYAQGIIPPHHAPFLPSPTSDKFSPTTSIPPHHAAFYPAAQFSPTSYSQQSHGTSSGPPSPYETHTPTTVHSQGQGQGQSQLEMVQIPADAWQQHESISMDPSSTTTSYPNATAFPSYDATATNAQYPMQGGDVNYGWNEGWMAGCNDIGYGLNTGFDGSFGAGTGMGVYNGQGAMGMGMQMEPLFNEDFDISSIPPIALGMPKDLPAPQIEEQTQSPHHEQQQGWPEQGYGVGGEKYGGAVEVMEMEMQEAEDPFLSSMNMGASSMSWDGLGMEGY